MLNEANDRESFILFVKELIEDRKYAQKVEIASPDENKYGGVSDWENTNTDEIITRASEIYADLYKRGRIIGDADISIAATALENNLVSATNNEAHFNRISESQILNRNK